MRIAVVDDERPARSELVYLIRQCRPDAEIEEADRPDKLLRLLESMEFDVCFVDIDLGGANGTTLASMIRSHSPRTRIVFATAFREYAVKAFELGATDYLLKPFDFERVMKTMERLREDLPAAGEKSGEKAGDAAVSPLNRLMVNTAVGYRVLDVTQIVYIETENRACRIHTEKESFLQNEPLSYYESRLRGNRFFRTHKSFIVNLDRVEEMVPMYSGTYGLKLRGSKEILPVGRTQMKEFRSLFEN